jgi:uncharacterized membrane protein
MLLQAVAEAEVAAGPLIQDPMAVLAVLLGFLALLFWADGHARLGRLFQVVPLLVFAYFVPTTLSNTGIIPSDGGFALYGFVKKYLLPAALLLMILAVDIKAIFGLGRNAVLLFLAATASIVIGGPIALFLCQGLVPDEMMDQAWRGLAALAGSWIGGGANMVALKETAGASDDIFTVIVVVDVAVANVWMACLLWFAGREKQMDAKLGADRTSLELVRAKVEDYQSEVSRPTDLPSLLMISALGIGGAVIANLIGYALPELGDFVSHFTWVVLLVSTIGLVLSFTPLRHLEGAGASRVGSVFLYLLVTTIGAGADFGAVLDPDNLGLVAVGAVWMLIHAVILLLLRHKLKAPIFFAAVGSKANIGGAASAPIVASAFHPALAPVGVLLAIGGYVLGTYAAR